MRDVLQSCGLPGRLSSLPSVNEVMKSFQFAVNDRCFVLQGTLPASIFQGDFKTSLRSLLPDDVCDGIEGILVKADMVPGKDLHFSFSVPCVDAGIAYQVRGLCATFFKAMHGSPQARPESSRGRSFEVFSIHGERSKLCVAGHAADEHLPGLPQGGDVQVARPANPANPAHPAPGSAVRTEPNISEGVPARTNGSGKPRRGWSPAARKGQGAGRPSFRRTPSSTRPNGCFAT